MIFNVVEMWILAGLVLGKHQTARMWPTWLGGVWCVQRSVTLRHLSRGKVSCWPERARVGGGRPVKWDVVLCCDLSFHWPIKGITGEDEHTCKADNQILRAVMSTSGAVLSDHRVFALALERAVVGS
eukprot:3793543-Amphidinium_carterae.1